MSWIDFGYGVLTVWAVVAYGAVIYSWVLEIRDLVRRRKRVR